MRVFRYLISNRRLAVILAGLAAITVTMPMRTAHGATADYAVHWSGSVASRSLSVPGSQGGYFHYVVASYRLWIPSGGTWHVESAVTATGVPKSTAPGSTYGRVSFGLTLECGPDQRDSAGRLTSPAALSVSGRNLLYDQTRTNTARALWTAVRGANRCQVVISVGRDDLAVAGKRITLNSGYVRLIGRGLDNPGSQALYGVPQTASLGMPQERFLSPDSPTITSPNFQITGYVAPPALAIAGNGASRPPVTRLDVIADAYVTTCYSTSGAMVGPYSHLPTCPYSNGTVLTAATYQSQVIVQQYHANGSLCRQTASPMQTYSTTGYVHHQEVRNRLAVVIDSACSSRTFRAKLFLRWVSGNTFYVEASPHTRIMIRPIE
jgi:hypothetical protein